jgi:N-acetylmuramic acid 6-phosphate etherase
MVLELDKLLTEQVNPATAGIDGMDTSEMLRVINDEDQKIARAVAREIQRIAAAVDKIVSAFRCGGRLIYLGAGTSGRLGVLDAAECVPTFGVEPGMVIGLIAGGEAALSRAVEGAEDQCGEVVNQLQSINLHAADVVVGLAASGRTPYVVAGLEYARKIGACTVAVSCTPASAVGEIAEIAITPLVGPEVITGSTRMKAGTAQKMVLNMLSTAAMVRMGKVYGNLMVDVRPTNFKLVERAKRIVAEAAGVTREQAEKVLAEAGLQPKKAIIMIKRGCSADQAESFLTAAGGLIGRALAIEEKEIEG